MTTMPQPKALNYEYNLIYDAWNHLITVVKFGPELVTYRYDGLHRRIRKDITDGSADDVEYYYNNQWQVLEERKGASLTTDRKYVYHPHYVDAVAVGYDGTGTSSKHFYLHDALFNVTAIMDDAGTVQQRYAYSPYGEATVLKPNFEVETGTPFDNEYLFTGRRADPETGLQINRYRYYHAPLGRWVNRDPIEYEGGDANLYGYVDGSPVHKLDPYGLFGVWPVEPGPDPGIDISGNCWRYGCNDPRKPDEPPRVNPGHPAPTTRDELDDYLTCSSVMSGVLATTGVSAPFPDGECPCDTYRIQVVVNPGKDYHFYKEDDEGNWSDKPGMTHVRPNANPNVDAPAAGYTSNCGYACVDGDGADTDAPNPIRGEEPLGPGIYPQPLF